MKQTAPIQTPIRDPGVLQRMSMAFELYELAEQMMRQNLRRRSPQASEEDIERGIRRWLLGRPEDAPGGGDFPSSKRFRG